MGLVIFRLELLNTALWTRGERSEGCGEEHARSEMSSLMNESGGVSFGRGYGEGCRSVCVCVLFGGGALSFRNEGGMERRSCHVIFSSSLEIVESEMVVN